MSLTAEQITLIGIVLTFLLGTLQLIANRKGGLAGIMETQEKTIAHLQDRLGIAEGRLETLELGTWDIIEVTRISVTGREGARIESHTQKIEAVTEVSERE